MRTWLLLPLAVLGACEQLDPRPTCPWELHLDPVEPSAHLEERRSAACTPNDSVPDQILVETVRIDDAPVLDEDFNEFCVEENLFSVSTLTGIEPDDAFVRLWGGGQPDHVETDLEFPERVEDGAWYRVTFLVTLDGGDAFSEDGWSAWFRYGVEESVLFATCGE